MSSASVPHMPPITPRTKARCELLERYQTVLNQEPWGLKVREDITNYQQELAARKQAELKKREQFRLGLASQIEERKSLQTARQKQMQEETQRERSMIEAALKASIDEKVALKEKHKKEILECKEQIIQSAQQQRAEMEAELQAAEELRCTIDREKGQEREEHDKKLQKQRQLAEEMELANRSVKQQKEAMIREGRESDKALVQEYIKQLDEKEKIKEEFRVKHLNAQRGGKVDEDGIPRLDLSTPRQKEILEEREMVMTLTQRQRMDFEAKERKKKEASVAVRRFLESQIDRKKALKEETRKCVHVERQAVDKDAALYKQFVEDAKRKKKERNAEYRRNLHQQMQNNRERATNELISPQRIR